MAKKHPPPITLFAIREGGTRLTPLIDDDRINCSPIPDSCGHHYICIKVLSPNNYEIRLGDLNSYRPVRLTYSHAVDSYPYTEPDGH